MRIRQIVFAAHDLVASRALLATLFQLAPPYQDPNVAEFGIDNAVFCFGDQFIEVIAPVQAGSACARHLARHGDSGYMLILQTDDLARERQRFTQLGLRTVWSKELADISAMHLHPKDVGGAIVSVDEPRPAPSWRWGGPDWRVAAGRAGQQRVRGITLHSPQPEALARHWASMFGRPGPQRVGAHWRVLLSEGFVDVARGAGPHEGVAGFTLAVAEPDAVLAAAAAMGLAVHPEGAGHSLHLLGARLAIQALA